MIMTMLELAQALINTAEVFGDRKVVVETEDGVGYIEGLSFGSDEETITLEFLTKEEYELFCGEGC